VSIELTITEHGGPGGQVQKTVTMLVSDRQSGSLRSQGLGATLNLDAKPSVYADNSILVSLTLEYLPGPPAPRGGEETRGRFLLHESMSLLLTSGRPILISEASDPASNRRVTVELKATVLQ
jgi:hypothetical protein